MNGRAFSPGTVVTLLQSAYNDDKYRNTLYDNSGSLIETKFTIVGPVSNEEYKATYTKEVEITLPAQYIQLYNPPAEPRTSFNRAREAISTSAQRVANRASGASTSVTNIYRGVRNRTQGAVTAAKYKLGASLFGRPRKTRRTRKNRR